MKTSLFALFSILPALSMASLTYSTIDGRPTITGNLDGPLTLFGAKDMTLDITGDYPVVIRDCEGIVIKATLSTTGRPLTVVRSKNIAVKDSTFDALGGDCDAVLVSGRDWLYDGNSDYSYYAYRSVWAKTWDAGKVEFGEPVERGLNPGWVWNTTTSYRTGQKIFHGYNPKEYSKDIRFTNCKFLNAKRAGLFVHHSEDVVVEGAFVDPGAFKTQEADISFEWTARSTIRNSRTVGNGLFSHYHNLGMVVDSFEAPNGVIQLMSHGQPVKQIDILNAKVKGLRVWNGQQFNYSAAGWIEDVKVKGGEFGYIWVASGQVDSKTPEVLVKNFVAENVTVNWTKDFYPVAVRLESVQGYAISGTINGVVQDFAVGGRVPSTVLVR